METSRRRTDETAADALRRAQAAGCRWLQFDSHLERLFQADLRADARSARLHLLLILLTIHLATPLYYVSLLQVPAGFVATGYAWLYGLQLPAIVATLLVVWLRPTSRWNNTACLFGFVALIIGVLGQRATGVVYDFEVPVEFAAVVIAGFLVAARLRFWHALPWALAATTAMLLNDWLFLPASQAATYHMLCALMLIAVSLLWGYSLECNARESWLTTRLLDHLSQHDSLTGLFNRMALDQRLHEAVDAPAVGGHSVTLAMVDIDYFKAYNDTYGHARGDAVIVEVARMCRATAQRSGGVCARYGGEELALLWRDLAFDSACAQLQALQSALAAQAITHAGSPIADRLTLSVGLFHVDASRLTSFGDTGIESRGQRLLETTDCLLYDAKNAGRNRIVAAQDPPANGSADQGRSPPDTQADTRTMRA